MIMTGVANTGGNIVSLNRFARCSGWTSRLKEPLAPTGICLMGFPPPRAGSLTCSRARRPERSKFDDLPLQPLGDGFGPRAGAELSEQRFDVEFDRMRRDAEVASGG